VGFTRKLSQVSKGLILAGILIVSCTDETTIIQSPGGIAVDGTVYIWRCEVYDVYNNPWNGDMRFASRTGGDSAKVTFVRLNGLSHSVFTDDSSSFNRILDKGAYIIVVETGWTEPDTIQNVYLNGDTTIRIDLVFDYLHPIDLSISFWYKDGDSLGADAEWDYIRLLNGCLQNKLDISGYDPPQDLLDLRYARTFFGDDVYVNWRISIRRPPYHIGDVLRQASDILAHYPDRFPELFQVHQYYAYICLD